MNDDKVKITVIIPVYNRAAYLPFAIKSVLAQSFAAWKLIIADDASTDKTQEAARPFLSDPRVEYIRFAQNRGTGANLAAALQLVQTPYFVILDSDDWLDVRALDILLHEMENQDDSTGLVYGNSIHWSEQKGRIQAKKVEKYRTFTDKYDFMLYHPMVRPRFFRTQAVREVGGFELDDPHQGRFMEDRYILLKLIAKYRFHHVDIVLYNLRLHESNISGAKNIVKFEETRLYVYPKILKMWNDEYEPVFERIKGWLHLSKLLPKRKGIPVRQPAETAANADQTDAPGPKVTVVMPTYNRAPFIKEAVQSVLDQMLQDWRLLIIDDASADGTEELLSEYWSDHRITYVKRPINGGIGPVLNDALKLVTTPYFMQLDADDWIEKETLSLLLGGMEQAGEHTALAYGNSIYHKKKKDGIITDPPFKHREFTDKYDVLLYRWMVVPRFYRTQSVRAVGGWDLSVPFHGRYMEDRQMFYKLAEHFKFLYIDREFYHYRLHDTNLSLSNREKYAEIRVYLVQYFFHKWKGTEQTHCVIEWHLNAEGWPQFRLVPVEQRKKHLFVLASASRDELTERVKHRIAEQSKEYLLRGCSVVVFTLDGVNERGRYIRGIPLEQLSGNPPKEALYPLPDKLYLENAKLYEKAKKWGETAGCEVLLNFPLLPPP
ncbi:glycosyltransferase family 2 protein [Paenibacillus thalictri]|uniref:glycosyltransferase family 2 protein n=1 Tax=Paenibacillus thalictri TaxID=2527873 RepID=UPI0013EEEF36|nr:glycosyltransferase family 2 protein [Paenibacillus thalictri]